jgi:formyl-CoA transferase
MSDHPRATDLYAAIVTALCRREAGGAGRASPPPDGLWAMPVSSKVGCAASMTHRAPRAGPNALANHYRCRDGRWFIMALHNEPRQWRGFLAAIGRADLADDPRFATSAARKQHASAPVQVLDAVFAQCDLADWRTLLDAAGVTFGAVQSVNEIADDRQMHQIGALVPFADGAGLTVAPSSGGRDKVAPRRPPRLGSTRMCCGAGYARRIERLRALGAGLDRARRPSTDSERNADGNVRWGDSGVLMVM